MVPPWAPCVDRFCHQYLQLEPVLDFPPDQLLRLAEVQDAVYARFFADGAVQRGPPDRYRAKTLKELIARVEAAIEDWDEHAVSDRLMSALALLLASPLPPESAAAQKRCRITYRLSLLARREPPAMTLLERRAHRSRRDDGVPHVGGGASPRPVPVPASGRRGRQACPGAGRRHGLPGRLVRQVLVVCPCRGLGRVRRRARQPRRQTRPQRRRRLGARRPRQDQVGRRRRTAEVGRGAGPRHSRRRHHLRPERDAGAARDHGPSPGTARWRRGVRFHDAAQRAHGFRVSGGLPRQRPARRASAVPGPPQRPAARAFLRRPGQHPHI